MTTPQRARIGSLEWAAKNLTDNMRSVLSRIDAEPLAAAGDLRRTCDALVRRGMAARSRTDAGDVFTITDQGRAVNAAASREERA